MSSPWIIETNEQYHAKKEYMSGTQLVYMSQSPRHYKKLFIDALDKEPTTSMVRGTMIHSYLLEPAKFKERYAMLPDKASEAFKHALFTTEELKAKAKEMEIKGYYKMKKADVADAILEIDDEILIWDNYVEELCEGRIPIKLEDQALLTSIFESVAGYPQAMNLIKDGVPEVSGYWKDSELKDENGNPMACKFMADWINERDYIIEIKSARDVDYWSFRRQIKKLRYDIKAAWYGRGFRELTGRPPKGFVWFVIGNKQPGEVALYSADDSCMSRGEFGDEDETPNGSPVLGYRDAITLYLECKKTNVWPGAQKQVEPMSMV